MADTRSLLPNKNAASVENALCICICIVNANLKIENR
jgi:hypothetical protein